ncbi:MAG: DUF1345 domain-containing protein [Chthoniobacterales bacterium]
MAHSADWFIKQDARHRFIISTLLGVVAWLLLDHRVGMASRVVATWDVFALATLALTWNAILHTPLAQLRKHARDQDLSHFLIFVFVVIAACASLFSVVFLYSSAKAGAGTHLKTHIGLSAIAVLSGWALVHTVFGLRYAHVFYGDNEEDAARHAGGLDFPGEKQPDYMDFAYFSFVIGMTFQVSDVQITSARLRQLVLLHGILSFAFNTVILALTINTISSLL